MNFPDCRDVISVHVVLCAPVRGAAGGATSAELWCFCCESRFALPDGQGKRGISGRKGMGFEKLKLPAAAVLVCMAFFVTFMQVKANEETDDPVSPSAVWSPDSDDLDDIAKACQTEPAARYGNCFVDQMGSLASSEAVAFSQALLQQAS